MVFKTTSYRRKANQIGEHSMGTATLLLFVLMCKHAVCDLAIQSFRTPTDKYKYFNKGFHVHSLDHAVGTFVVLLFFINPLYAAVFAFIDYIFHWHIDWAKTNITRKYGWTKDGKAFWRLQTFDQIAHYSTYALIVYLMFKCSFCII